MKHIVTVLTIVIFTLLLSVTGCNDCPDCPVCPDCDSCCPVCPETLKCPDGYTLEKLPLVWECVKDQEPPPNLGLYVNIERARALAVHFDSNDQRVYNVHAGWRDPEYVLNHCAWAVGTNAFFPMTQVEMEDFVEEGFQLDALVRQLIMDLPITNKRCNPNHAQYHPDFCKKSNVRKARLKAFLLEWNPHLDKATELREVAQEDPVRQICEYDGIKKWCQCRNEHGG